MRGSAICRTIGLGLAIVVASVPAHAATEATSIPQAFQGQWSASAASCNAADEDTSGLTVSPFELSQYDGRAYVTSVSIGSASEITVSADWEGEGRKWSEKDRLKLTKSGAVLKFTRLGKSGPGSEFTVVRCP